MIIKRVLPLMYSTDSLVRFQ